MEVIYTSDGNVDVDATLAALKASPCPRELMFAVLEVVWLDGYGLGGCVAHEENPYACCCGEGAVGSYEGPLADCPVHGGKAYTKAKENS